ncbi:MAG: threonylcarbamoyl-AMP synthase [Candidatus Aminicenantes bacterium]|nr:threonylcarbamoyl-AMP synthase [Candidatus Aminicenantes bacterium]
MIVIPYGEITAPGRAKKVRDCLRDEGVIAYPTDTLYGLGGNFFSLAASARIDAMKGRSAQPYSVAVGSLAMLQSLVADLPVVFRERLQRLLPGKFTFLFAPALTINPILLRGSERIGIRLPSLPGLLGLIEETGLPWLSTSVNRSGRPPLNDPERIVREFSGIDLLIDGGMLPASAGSTVVDLTVAPPRIVRPGDDHEKISAALEGA